MILLKREQLRDYWPIYHPHQSALKIEFLIAFQMTGASAIDIAMYWVPFNTGQTLHSVFNFLPLFLFCIKRQHHGVTWFLAVIFLIGIYNSQQWDQVWGSWSSGIMHVKVCVSHPCQPSNDAVWPRHQRVTLPFHQGSDDICSPPLGSSLGKNCDDITSILWSLYCFCVQNSGCWLLDPNGWSHDDQC